MSFYLSLENETQISNAVEHVQSGTVALQKVKSLQQNSREWMRFAIMIPFNHYGLIWKKNCQMWLM